MEQTQGMNIFLGLSNTYDYGLNDEDLFGNPLIRRTSGFEEFGPISSNANFLLPDSSPLNI